MSKKFNLNTVQDALTYIRACGGVYDKKGRFIPLSNIAGVVKLETNKICKIIRNDVEEQHLWTTQTTKNGYIKLEVELFSMFFGELNEENICHYNNSLVDGFPIIEYGLINHDDITGSLDETHTISSKPLICE